MFHISVKIHITSTTVQKKHKGAGTVVRINRMIVHLGLHRKIISRQNMKNNWINCSLRNQQEKEQVSILHLLIQEVYIRRLLNNNLPKAKLDILDKNYMDVICIW